MRWCVDCEDFVGEEDVVESSPVVVNMCTGLTYLLDVQVWMASRC
jgi:hypothetical protein